MNGIRISLIGDGERGFPAVIISEPLLMLRMEAQIISSDLVTSSSSSSSPRTSLESMAM